MPELNAIGIVVSDMRMSIRFYRLLGLDMPDTADEGHVEASMPSGTRSGASATRSCMTRTGSRSTSTPR
jgi:catechol 2,3-dioxygenase-like lactoylglutathione lyase family enzyme